VIALVYSFLLPSVSLFYFGLILFLTVHIDVCPGLAFVSSLVVFGVSPSPFRLFINAWSLFLRFSTECSVFLSPWGGEGASSGPQAVLLTVCK